MATKTSGTYQPDDKMLNAALFMHDDINSVLEPTCWKREPIPESCPLTSKFARILMCVCLCGHVLKTY